LKYAKNLEVQTHFFKVDRKCFRWKAKIYHRYKYSHGQLYRKRNVEYDIETAENSYTYWLNSWDYDDVDETEYYTKSYVF
jgi:hypothetical protein